MRIFDLLSWAALLVQLVAVALSIRLYRRHHALPFGLLVATCVCLLVSDTSVSTFGFVSGLLGQEAGSQESATLQYWSEYISFIFTWLFLIALLGTLVAFLRRDRQQTARTV